MRVYKKRLKITKMINRSLFIVLLSFCVLLSGFTEFESDNLYSYQWGLKNKGNFFVDRGVLADDYDIIYHDKSIADALFQDNKAVIDNFKLTIKNPGIAYANENIDIKWEEGYSFFKSVPSKTETIVAVIDSGVDINHFELKENIWINRDEILGNGIDDDKNGYIDDVYGWNFYDNSNNVYVDKNIDIHGTHAAGTIIAKHHNGGIRGIANDPSIKVMPIKILGENGKGSMNSLITAINYAKANGAKICNISLGAYKYDATLDQVIKENPDMLFVVAAGNGANFIGYSLDEKDVYPAKLGYDNVITVSNVCFDGERYISANYGSPVDIFAPGTFILSTAPDNNFGYFTGTSMAAPFVSATCAMIHSAFSNVPVSMYKSLIINGATKIEKLRGLSKNGGMLNIANTLVLASGI